MMPHPALDKGYAAAVSQAAPASTRRALQSMGNGSPAKPAAAVQYSQALKPHPPPLKRVTRNAARKRAAGGAAGCAPTPPCRSKRHETYNSIVAVSPPERWKVRNGLVEVILVG